MSYERCEVHIGGLPPVQVSFVGPTLKTEPRDRREGVELPPILLIHGFDSNALEFRNIYPYLSQDTDVFAVDLIGCELGS